jgi:hypothetical protein
MVRAVVVAAQEQGPTRHHRRRDPTCDEDREATDLVHSRREPIGRPARDHEAEHEQPAGVDGRGKRPGPRVARWATSGRRSARQIDSKQGHAYRRGIGQVVGGLGEDPDRMRDGADGYERANEGDVGDQDGPQTACSVHWHRGPPSGKGPGRMAHNGRARASPRGSLQPVGTAP